MMTLVSEEYELDGREGWVLRLLYAPAQGQECKPIVGDTRLMKGLFLVHKRLQDEFSKETPFEFIPEKYGPLDPKVYDAVESLERQNLIKKTTSEKYNGDEFRLTPEGKPIARQLFEELSEEERELVEWIKTKHVMWELPRLLSFVYRQYPDYARESVLR